IVVLAAVELLVGESVGAESGSIQQSALDQEVEGPVDRRPRHEAIALADLDVEPLDVEVLAGVEDGIEDDFPLAGHPETARGEELPKLLPLLRFAQALARALVPCVTHESCSSGLSLA